MRGMKRWLSVLLAAALLAYLLSSCSGHIIKKNTVVAALSPAGQLLTLAEWSADSDTQTLTFSEDGTGAYAAAPFEWTEADGAARLRFFPGCMAGAERTAKLDTSGGALRLTLDDATFTPAFLTPPDKEAEPAVPRPTAEELLGQQIAEYASGYIGAKYKYGGKSPETGFDCSGFVSWVVNHSGWNVGRLGAQGLYNICTPTSNPKPGDLVFFVGTYDTAGVSHCGIYVGDGMMIHCGDPIQYANLNTSYWQSHFYAYGRLP